MRRCRLFAIYPDNEGLPDEMKFYRDYFSDIAGKLNDVDLAELDGVAKLIKATGAADRSVIFVGNGGSAAMASHVSVDLTKVGGVRTINFNEADLLTCLANDYGYEHWVEKALEFYGRPGDLVVLISSSGRSPNIVNGAKAARALKMTPVTLSGFDADNPLRGLGDVNLWVNSRSYNVVEMTHHIWLLAAVDRIVASKDD
jgi:D-sedoheptulose 7-phosphate isomerase